MLEKVKFFLIVFQMRGAHRRSVPQAETRLGRCILKAVVKKHLRETSDIKIGI